MVAVLPVIGHARVAEDEPDKISEARLGANIVRQDDDTTLTGLDADCGVILVSDAPYITVSVVSGSPLPLRMP